jgi:hypothetical protein
MLWLTHLSLFPNDRKTRSYGFPCRPFRAPALRAGMVAWQNDATQTSPA